MFYKKNWIITRSLRSGAPGFKSPVRSQTVLVENFCDFFSLSGKIILLYCIRRFHIFSCLFPLISEGSFVCLFFFSCCGAATQRGSWPPHS